MMTAKECNEHAKRLAELLRMTNLIITGIELETIAREINCATNLNEKVIINDMYIGVCTGVFEDTVTFRIEEINR